MAVVSNKVEDLIPVKRSLMCLIMIWIILRAVVPVLNWPTMFVLFTFEIWTTYPQSVNERRSMFFKLIGSILDQSLMNANDLEDELCVKI